MRCEDKRVNCFAQIPGGRRRMAALLAAALGGCLLLSSAFATPWDSRQEAASPGSVVAFNAEPIQPIPQSIELDPQKVALGKRLFHDPLLSHDNTISCSSCHDLSKGGTD